MNDELDPSLEGTAAEADTGIEEQNENVVPEPILVAGRSYKNLDELKKAHDSLTRDYSRVTQGLPSKLNPTVNNVKKETNDGGVETDELEIIKNAAEKLRAYGGIPSMEDLDRKLEIREFVGSRNVMTDYDDLKISKDDELIMEARLKMGIPLDETYNALKADARVRHAGEERKNFTPKRTADNAQNRSSQAVPAIEIKPDEYTLDNLSANIGKVMEAAGGAISI